MAIKKGNLKLKNDSEITTKEEADMLIFLQGAVSIQVKKSRNEWFGFRDLMGGDNFN